MIGAGYWAYDAVRDVTSVSHRQAIADAHAIYHVEGALGLAHEHTLNQALVHLPWLAVAANYWYVLLHLGVTATALTWLYFRRPTSYRSARSLLVGASLVAFAVFVLFPAAPPRLLPGGGFVDTLATHHTIASYETGSLASAADLYAAMPSLHVAWSLWVAVVGWRNCDRTWLRVVAVCYPVLTSVDVIATANHYVLDVFAAGLLIALSVATQHAWWSLRARRSRAGAAGNPQPLGRREPVQRDASLPGERVA